MDTLFNQMVLEKNESIYEEVRNSITLYKQINSKQMKYLNTWSHFIRLLKEKIKETPWDIDIGNDFLENTPDPQTTRT